MSNIRKYYGVYIFLTITILSSIAYFSKEKEKKRILENGIYKKAYIEYVSFIKNDWLLNITYTLDKKTIHLESIGTSKRHYAGDSVLIMIMPHGPQKTAIIVN